MSLPVSLGDAFTNSELTPGDPFDYSVILWTRVKPVGTYRIDIPACVKYKVWTDDASVKSEGFSLTGADIDWTVKVVFLGKLAP